MKPIKNILWIALLAFTCTACEKVIDIKLADSTPRIVIEGEITPLAGPYQVRVTESKNFSENNTFPGRADAVVVIKDLTTTNQETLAYTADGFYQTIAMQGVAGHAYQLTVTVGGKTYTATSTIPAVQVKLQRLTTKPFSLDADKIFMVPIFTDPVGKGNNYRIRQWINDIPVKGSYVRNDDATDGRTYDSPAYYDTDEETGNPLIHNGDKITAELQSIDKGVYDYFRTLNTTVDQNSSTPSNPLSNISGGALGVFNACNPSKLSVIAKF